MMLAEIVEGKREALRVAEVAQILDVSIKKIYRMAAKGQIPSLKNRQLDPIRPARYCSMAEKPIQHLSHSGNFTAKPCLSEERKSLTNQ